MTFVTTFERKNIMRENTFKWKQQNKLTVCESWSRGAVDYASTCGTNQVSYFPKLQFIVQFTACRGGRADIGRAQLTMDQN